MTIDEWQGLTRQQRRRAWLAMTVQERRDLYDLLSADTPLFGLPYPVDYNDPADSPTALRALALDTDAALATRAATADLANLRGSTWPVKHSSWEGYKAVSNTSPAPIGYAAQVSRTGVGVWRVQAMSYVDVQGGTSSDQGAGTGIIGYWADGTTMTWLGGMQATIGRVTAYRGTRLVVAQVSEGYVTNRSGIAARFAPSAWVYGSVVSGGGCQAGESRMSIEWMAQTFTQPVSFVLPGVTEE